MPPPPCTHPREPLSCYLDGEGGPLLRLQVALRLRRCPGCRAALDELRGADRWLAGVAVEPSPDLAERLLAQARALGPPLASGARGGRTGWLWRPAVGVAAAAAVAVVVAVGVGGRWLLAGRGDDLLYRDLTLFEEMDLIASLDMVQHFDEIQGVRLD